MKFKRCFLSFTQTDATEPENPAVLNAPYLINGFDEQEEILIKNLLNDELLYMIKDFSSSDKKAFIEALMENSEEYGF